MFTTIRQIIYKISRDLHVFRVTKRVDVTQSFIDLAAFCSSEQTQRNDPEAWVGSFIQIIVICPPEPRADVFVDRNAGKVFLRLSRLLTKSYVPQEVALTSESVN